MKVYKNILAYQFKKFIGYKKKVLEVGCGTGQLSIYFSLGTNNEIIAFDPTIESLDLAKNFKSSLINLMPLPCAQFSIIIYSLVSSVYWYIFSK